MRTEISSLSIKMSRYFISVPVGPEALTLFNVALLYFWSPVLSPLPPPLPVYFISTRGPVLAGWGVSCQLCTPVGLDGVQAPSELIDFNQWFERLSWMMLKTIKGGQSHRFLLGGHCRRRFTSEGMSDKNTNNSKEDEKSYSSLIFMCGMSPYISRCVLGAKWPGRPNRCH